MLTDEEREELEELDRYMALCSLGDRPSAPSARKLARWMDLVEKSGAGRRLLNEDDFR